MSALDNLGPQFTPITSKEARGDSKPVSMSRFGQLAAKGQQMLSSAAEQRSTAGLDRDWEGLKDRAYNAAQDSWGGVTVNSQTGHNVRQGERAYAVTVRHPGQSQIRLPENASREHFGSAMDRAREQYPQLANRGHHLGVFHDDEEHSIDIDPVMVLKRKSEVDRVGTFTHAVGGAYSFRTGNGHFPPHVRNQ